MKQFFAGVLFAAVLVTAIFALVSGAVTINTNGQSLNNVAMPAPRTEVWEIYGGEITEQTATPDYGNVTFTILDDEEDEPEVVDLVPVLPPTDTPQYENTINWADEMNKPTATPRNLSDEQLLACLTAQQEKRRMAPYCPTNPAELLGGGR